MSGADEKRLQRKKVEDGGVHGPNGSVLHDDALPSGSRDFIDFDTSQYGLGFEENTIAPQSSANISAKARYAFCPQSLIIPEAMGVYFRLVGIKVGPFSQIHFPLELPCHVFSEKAHNVNLKMDVCPVDVEIILMIRNVSLQSQNFTATVIGELVDRWRR